MDRVQVRTKPGWRIYLHINPQKGRRGRDAVNLQISLRPMGEWLGHVMFLDRTSSDIPRNEEFRSSGESCQDR